VLRAAASKWEFEQILFVVGCCRSVDFYTKLKMTSHTKLKKLDVQEGKKDKLFADHTVMPRAQSGYGVLPPACAKIFEGNHTSGGPQIYAIIFDMCVYVWWGGSTMHVFTFQCFF